jgi:type III secretory pathway component EscS
MDGVVLRPSLFGITTGSLPSITATQELVVPKSIPITFLIFIIGLFVTNYFRGAKINHYANEILMPKRHFWLLNLISRMSEKR